MKTNSFEGLKVMLNCGICGACPAVEFNAEGVSIGEDSNTVHLTHAQWNDLVFRIRRGELPRVK